jgi:hypothetical protein
VIPSASPSWWGGLEFLKFPLMSPVSISQATRLDRIAWQYFGSLTFVQANLPTSVRRTMVFALFRKLAKPLRVYFPDLLWVLRLEEGEITRRRHFHLLIGGLPQWSVKRRSCFALMRTWEGLGGGMARMRIYDPRLAGESYLKKGLGFLSTKDSTDGVVTSMPAAHKTLEGANAYELGKFGSEEVLELTCSRSVIHHLQHYLEGSASRRGRDMSRGRR